MAYATRFPIFCLLAITFSAYLRFLVASSCRDYKHVLAEGRGSAALLHYNLLSPSIRALELVV
jgi:hypothetical protein